MKRRPAVSRTVIGLLRSIGIAATLIAATLLFSALSGLLTPGG